MSDKPISPLRQRMIDDMTARRYSEKVQKAYVRHVRTFAAFLGQSPDTATSDDLRRFQLHMAQQQISPGSINAAIAALRFFFTVTLERPDLVRPLTTVNKPRKAPVVLSQEEVARLLEAAPGLKYKAALGHYLQTGCGGLCGRITDEVHQVHACAPFEKVEMAVATTDMGHEGLTPDFGDDPQLRVDFAHRGVHVTAEAAKAIVAAFYGRPAARGYFIGCSDGGREGLNEAQRYPNDFDGIAAGAPAFNFQIQNTFYHAWNARSNTGPDGKPIIVAADLPFLHRAALKACHAEDGVIADPRRCAFDPAAALCAAGQDADCLTAEQVEAARKIYEGPRTADGVWLTVGGPQPGSELSWAGVYVPRPGSDDIFGRVIAGGTISHLAFDPNPPKSFGLDDFTFDRETFERLKPMHALYDATNSDLSPFVGRGGRLILWHGWSDPHISPLNSIAYYRAVRATLGAEAADKAVRLFLIPGLYHCEGGEGFTKTDILTPLIAWVEEGKAPGDLVLAGDNGTRPVFALRPLGSARRSSPRRRSNKGSTVKRAANARLLPERRTGAARRFVLIPSARLGDGCVIE